MWMGGNVPLGYDADERTLVINPADAETVRRIFALYRELGCVRRVKEEADRVGLRTKCSITANGTERGGKTLLPRSSLYIALEPDLHRPDRAQGSAPSWPAAGADRRCELV